MSETLMDTNPLLPTDAQIEKTAASDAPLAGFPAPPLPEVPRESALSPLVQVFVGPQGPHAGTRWLIYIVMGFVVIGICSTLLSALHPQRGGSVWWTMASELGMMLAAIVPGFVMARIERVPFGNFGLPARGAFGRNFWAGTLWGIASLSILMLVLRASRAFYFGSLDLHGARILEFALFYAVFFLFTGFFEDFLLRGYSQWVFSKAMNFWPAAALLSVIFGALHAMNPGETKVGLVAVVAIGFFLCLTLRRTGTLWWAVGFHMAWDWGESYLYSVPDSGTMLHGHLLNSSFNGPAWLTGGSDGPEASYLIFVLIALLWVMFDRVYPEVKYRD
jgi:membrane protease YdiL (CAAX protease family)